MNHRPLKTASLTLSALALALAACSTTSAQGPVNQIQSTTTDGGLASGPPVDLAGHPNTTHGGTPDLAMSSNPMPNPVPATLFGLHMKHADTTTAWPTATFGAWRSWDAHVTWPYIEPARGTWQWTVLDEHVALAEQHGVEYLYTFGLSPPWASARPNESSGYGPGNAAEPANLADWQEYVRQVATRYKGRIHYYEIWNEVNLTKFYTGSVDSMVALARTAYQTIKEIDPDAKVLCPSTTSGNTAWIDGYFSKGGDAVTDIVAYHFYVWPGPPENMLATIKKVQAVMAAHHLADRELWNTEAGWDIATSAGGSGGGVLDWDTASAYITRAYPLNWTAGVSRYFFYGWDDPAMGIVASDGKTLRPPAVAYGEMAKWLTGATLADCATDPSKTYVCHLTRPDNYRAEIVWSTHNAGATWTLPSPARRALDLAGGTTDLTGKTTIAIGAKPVLVEY